MDINLIKELMREFKECELTKLELKYNELEIKLEKKIEVVQAQQVLQSPVYQEVTGVGTSTVNTPIVAEKIDGHEITSPMVGTVYTAPSPDAEPFVTVGQKVKKGDVVCIIEAMKLMNEVEADIDGEVVEIRVKNEQMVQFGEPLFVIRP